MSEEPNPSPTVQSVIRTGAAVLRELYELAEPIASIYFGMADPAGDDVALRRRMVRHHLLRAATGTVVLDAVEDALSDVPQGRGTVAAYVGRDGSVRTFAMPEADLAVDRVSRAALPDVVPLLRWQQYRPAYVLAVLGQTGTEVSVRRSPWSEVTTITVPSSGDGASVPDYSAYSAETVTEALSSSGARLLILAGDARAVQYFQGRLPTWVVQRVRVLTAPDGHDPRPHLRTWPASDLAAMVDARLRETVASVINGSSPEGGGSGVQGVTDVIHALAHGELRELLVGAIGSVGSFSSLGSLGPGGAEPSAWFGPGPADIAESRPELAVEDDAKRQGPLADVLIRAATLTDVEVAILPLEVSEALHQGVGGIHR